MTQPQRDRDMKEKRELEGLLPRKSISIWAFIWAFIAIVQCVLWIIAGNVMMGLLSMIIPFAISIYLCSRKPK